MSAQKKTVMKITAKGDSTNLNIVLVHGIWFDGSSWNKVIPILRDAGHKVLAVELPLHSEDDLATVKRIIDLIGGPVILVAHAADL